MSGLTVNPIKPMRHLKGRHLGGSKFTGTDGGKFAVEVSANPASGWQGISIDCSSDERPDSHFELHVEEAVALRDSLNVAIEIATAAQGKKAA